MAVVRDRLTSTFACAAVEPNTSPPGIAVLATTLELKYGALRYKSSGEPAYLEHAELDHDPNHKVDWRRWRKRGRGHSDTDLRLLTNFLKVTT